jgi:hypothetical protein
MRHTGGLPRRAVSMVVQLELMVSKPVSGQLVKRIESLCVASHSQM